MILATFDGGLNTRLEPHLINPSESVIYTNVDNASGILKSIKDKTITHIPDALQYAFYFVAEAEWQFSITPTAWVEFQERLYWSDGVQPKKRIASITYNLGIDTPIGVIVGVATSAPAQNTRVDFATAAGGDLPSGRALQYRIVHNDIVSGFRSRSAIIQSLTLESGINETNLTSPDTNFVSNSDVYRNFDGFWRLVGNFATSGATVNDAVYDISANAELVDPTEVDGTIQYALTYFSSIDGSESAPLLSSEIIVEHGSIALSGLPVSSDSQVTGRKLYRIGGNVTIFTLVTTLDNIVTTYIDTISDVDLEGSLLTSLTNTPPGATLQFLTENNAMLFGAIDDKLYFTPIGQPTAWPVLNFLDFPRPITGLAKSAGGLLVFTEFETYLVTGSGPTSLAQQILSADQGCILHYSIVGRASFAIWASSDGICMSDGGSVTLITKDKLNKINLLPVNAVLYDQEYYLHQTDGTTLIIDFARNIIKTSEYGIISLVVANDILYGYFENNLYTIGTSEALLDLHYKSPRFIGKAYTSYKQHKNVRVNTEGEFTCNIITEAGIIITRDLTEDDIVQLKLPNEHTRSEFIQFELIGKGEIPSIAYDEEMDDA